MSSFDRLHPAIQHHIVNSLGWRSLRPLQEQAIEPLLAREHALLLAPTAGGKTEAAFFPLLSRMMSEDWRGLSLLYVCPIKALLNNLERRLAEYAGYGGRRVACWHGDVPESARRRIRAEPPDVLLTTPESIEVLLVSRRSDPGAFFAGVQAVVVDELHAFAGDDRGWHLLSVLERVARVAGREIQRVGLSATIGNAEELLEWLAASSERPRRVIRPPETPGPVPEIGLDYVGTLENAALVISQLHRGEKRLVFADSRASVEQIAAALRARGVDTFVSHSSLSVDERRRAEQAFAEGRDCVIVATSTLELGIDVGDLDRVIQIDAPATVSSFLQRLGRTGRRADASRNCLFLTTKPENLLHAAGLLTLWHEGFVEPVVPPPEPLHVFAQQLMALALQTGGLERGSWRQWIGRVPAFDAMGEVVPNEILENMLAQGIFFEDGGLLWFGEAGERAFGRKNFLEVLSVITSDPLFTVLHGRTQLGMVHPSSFLAQQNRLPVLLLGGRSWLVTHVEWRDRIAYVESTTDAGRSRWIGEGRALRFEMCRAMRRVLATRECPGRLSSRAAGELESLYDQYAWADETGTALVVDANDKSRWWTFAGLRANLALTGALGDLCADENRPNNLSIAMRREATSVAVAERLGSSSLRNVYIDSEVLNKMVDGFKFASTLPRSLAERLARSRATDASGAAQCAQEGIKQIQIG